MRWATYARIMAAIDAYHDALAYLIADREQLQRDIERRVR
jgi:hypothetical protein